MVHNKWISPEEHLEKYKTKRETFLEVVMEIVPWKQMEEMLQPFLRQTKQKGLT